MRRSHSQMVVVMLAAVTISVLALPVHAQTFVVNVRSWDALMADYLYMAELFGRGPNAKKELDEFVRANSGGKGVAWLDPGKPFGAYADLPDQIGTLPAYVIFLPLADEKTFLDALPALAPHKVEKGVDGVYLVQTNPIQKYYMRLSNKHAYVSSDAAVIRGKLRDPATINFGTRPGRPVAASLRVDRISKEYKKFVTVSLGLLNSLDSKPAPGETEAEFKTRHARINLALDDLTRLLDETHEITLHLEVNQQQHEAALEAAVIAEKNTRLAQQIKNLGAAGTMFGNLGRDAVASLGLRLLVPDEWQADLSTLALWYLDLEVSKVLNLKDKALSRRAKKAVEPTVKAGDFDLGLALQGPNPDGTCVFVVGFKLVEGKKMEQWYREVLRDQPSANLLVPEITRAKITQDFAKHGSARIHKMEPLRVQDSDKATLNLLGSPEAGVAIREDVFLLTQGRNCVQVIKNTLDGVDRGPVPEAMRLECSLAKLLTVMIKQYETPENRHNIDAVRKVLAAADKNRDRVTLRLQGGATLRLRFALHSQNVRTAGAIYDCVQHFSQKPPAK